MVVDYIISTMDALSYAFAIAGALVVIAGGVQAFGAYFIDQFSEARSSVNKVNYSVIRQHFAEKIVLSLEFFVAGDIVKTIATPSFSEIGKLAAIVAIRTVLSYSLGREINNRKE